MEWPWLSGTSALTSLLVVVAVVVHLVWQSPGWGKLKGKKLPPGSWGWPLVGETFGILRHFSAGRPDAFTKERFRKYGGNVIKTHFFGTPYVVVRGPEAAKLMATSEDHLVEAHHFLPARLLLGEGSMVNVPGARHKLYRRSLNAKFLGDELRKFLPRVEAITLEQMASWRVGDVRSAKDEAMKFTYNFIAGLVFTWGAGPERTASLELAQQFGRAVLSVPINLPGFTFHRGMLARKQLCDMFDREIELRRSGKIVRDDLLTAMLTATDPESADLKPVLDQQTIKDNLLLFILAGHETATTTLSWAIQYLYQNPNHWKALHAENEAIRSSKAPGEPLKWEDLSKMTFTTQVIQEVLRISSIAFYHHRGVKQDFKFQGYDVPKGWNIILDVHDLHHSPGLFSDPDTFDPSRFQEKPKPFTVMPFGTGPKMCLGKDLAHMELRVFLHHLVLKCKWTALEKEVKVQLQGGLPSPKGPVPIRIDAINCY